MYANQGGAFPNQADRSSGIETGTKLYISNLDYGVSNEDIKELFSECGDLKRSTIHYDKWEIEEIIFSRRLDAVNAVKRYNNVQLDGKPMKIEIVGSNVTSAPVAPAFHGTNGNFNAFPRGGQGRGGNFGRRGVGRGFGRGRGGGGGRG